MVTWQVSGCPMTSFGVPEDETPPCSVNRNECAEQFAMTSTVEPSPTLPTAAGFQV